MSEIFTDQYNYYEEQTSGNDQALDNETWASESKLSKLKSFWNSWVPERVHTGDFTTRICTQFTLLL